MRRLGWAEGLIVHAAVSELRHFKVTPQHYHADILDQIICWEALDLTFALCRHPFSRMKSEYYWQSDVGFNKGLAPEDWFNTVTENFSRDPCAFDNHIRPQVDFVPCGKPCKLLKLEDEGVRRAIESMNALAPAGWFNRGLRGVSSIRRQQSKSIPEIESEFLRLRTRIEDFYASDMKYFGY
jgi:hypothetical protein